MRLRKTGALLLALLMTACASTPRPWHEAVDPYERELEAARYELRVLTASSGHDAPVEVDPEDFQRAMRSLTRDFQPVDSPADTARWLLEGQLHTSILAETRGPQVLRLLPLDEHSPLLAESLAQMTQGYLSLCQHPFRSGDCLGFLEDGPTLKREDLRMLALSLSLQGVLGETWSALQDMVSPQALIAMIVWTAGVYLAMWLLPEPTTKLLAGGMTLALLAWLPAATLWELMDGWARHKSLKEIPAKDPVGDEIEAAAQQVARKWGPDELKFDEEAAITRAYAEGRPWLAHLLERQARGRFVENALRGQFPRLRWNPHGVDAVDPSTGYRYEVLSGTDSNLALHGRRMAEELFRFITF